MNNSLSIKTKHMNRGFTLVESLVAISILLVAIVAPLTLVVNSLQLSKYATTRMVAGFLAQDALEYIRNVKDSNALTGAGWLSYIPSGCFGSSNFCAVDTTKGFDDVSSGAFVSCGAYASGCPALKRDTTTFRYNLNPASDSNLATIYTRSIQIVDSVNSALDDKFVFVTVSWTIGSFSKSITTQTSLRDWHS